MVTRGNILHATHTNFGVCFFFSLPSSKRKFQSSCRSFFLLLLLFLLRLLLRYKNTLYDISIFFRVKNFTCTKFRFRTGKHCNATHSLTDRSHWAVIEFVRFFSRSLAELFCCGRFRCFVCAMFIVHQLWERSTNGQPMSTNTPTIAHWYITVCWSHTTKFRWAGCQISQFSNELLMNQHFSKWNSNELKMSMAQLIQTHTLRWEQIARSHTWYVTFQIRYIDTFVWIRSS